MQIVCAFLLLPFHLLPPSLSTPPSTFLFHLPFFSFLFFSFSLLSSSSLSSFFFYPSFFTVFSLSFPGSFPPSITLSSSSLSSTFFFSTVSLFSFTHSSSQFEPLLEQRPVNTTTENEVIRKQFISVCWNQSASGYLEHV